ncbi:hypothetical protein C2W62_29890 [Candidatus Entotheonella serta]|nr:hypothetical protein C2W62_29890 [Candidatus Entotheonella serta]
MPGRDADAQPAVFYNTRGQLLLTGFNDAFHLVRRFSSTWIPVSYRQGFPGRVITVAFGSHHGFQIVAMVFSVLGLALIALDYFRPNW